MFNRCADIQSYFSRWALLLKTLQGICACYCIQTYFCHWSFGIKLFPSFSLAGTFAASYFVPPPCCVIISDNTTVRLCMFFLLNSNKFYLVAIAALFDLNSRRKNFDISSATQRFYSKEAVVLWALLLTKGISTQITLSKFPHQRVKGIRQTSGEIDFRFWLKLKIGPQCVLGVLCFLLMCYRYYYFRLEFCLQMLVSGSSIATSEKVNKPLQFVRGKCMVEYCSLNTHFII